MKFVCLVKRPKAQWLPYVESSWNVMAHGRARDGKWRGNWRMEWVSTTLLTTSEHGVSTITTADAHTSAASSWVNWHPRRSKWTSPFRRKTKSGFCACAITFQTQSTKFNIQPTECVYVFRMGLRTNSDYLPTHHWLTGFYNRGGRCLLCGTDWICKYSLD